jgi:hypothetical protein
VDFYDRLTGDPFNRPMSVHHSLDGRENSEPDHEPGT